MQTLMNRLSEHARPSGRTRASHPTATIITDQVGAAIIRRMIMESTDAASTSRIPGDTTTWEFLLRSTITISPTMGLGQWSITTHLADGTPTTTDGSFAPAPSDTPGLKYHRDGVWSYHDPGDDVIVYTGTTPDGASHATAVISPCVPSDQASVTTSMIRVITAVLHDAALPTCSAPNCSEKGRVPLRAICHTIAYGTRFAPGDVTRVCPDCHLEHLHEAKTTTLLGPIEDFEVINL